MSDVISACLGGFLAGSVAMFAKMLVHHVVLVRRERRKGAHRP